VASENLTQTLPTESRPKGTFLSPSTIKSGKWFRHRPGPEQPTALGAIVKTLIGVAVGVLAYAWGAQSLAILIWVVSGLIGVVSLSSQKARTGVGQFFGALGRGIGWVLGAVLLTPIFLIGFTIAHVVGRLAGRDPLHLRDTTSQTFWLPVDQDRRKVRYIRSLFATETPAPARGWGIITLISLVSLVVVAELVLRSYGFGNAILYQPDAQAGYYPAPNQAEHRYGGFIQTNAYGMRAPDFDPVKKPGTLRILMLGDSTLYGGSFIDQRDLYARLLDDALDAKPGVNSVEVLNVAANAWGPFNELGYVEQFGTFDADVAVVALPIGDIYRPLALLTGLPYFSVDAPPRLALEEVLHHLNWRSRQMFRKPGSLEAYVRQGQLGIEAYIELAKRLRASGCEVLFEVLPSAPAGMNDVAPEDEQRDTEALRAALEPLGIPVGYPVGLFKDKGTASEMYHDRTHLHTGGQHVYANYLKSRLEQQSAKLRAHSEGGSPDAATEAAPQ
jgi:hypothetical protein